MSRGGDRKPVGFATQLTAGGIAGAMEAVSSPFVISRGTQLTPPAAHLPATRHHQGPDAAFPVWSRTRGTSRPPFFLQKPLTSLPRTDEGARVRRDRPHDRTARDATRAVQGARRGAFWDCSQDGCSVRVIRALQELARGPRDRQDESGQHLPRYAVARSVIPISC